MKTQDEIEQSNLSVEWKEYLKNKTKNAFKNEENELSADEKNELALNDLIGNNRFPDVFEESQLDDYVEPDETPLREAMDEK